MNLTRYNPNLDRGISTQANISGLRCFDGEDLCNSNILTCFISEGTKSQALIATAERMDPSIDQR